MESYRLQHWRLGFIGIIEVDPRRRVQALIRARGAEAEAIERWLILCDIKAILDDRTIAPDPLDRGMI